MLDQNGSLAKGIAVYCLYNTPRQYGPIRAFPQTNVGRGNGTADRLTATGGFRFPKICSRNEILEIANFDGKTGKLRVTENTSDRPKTPGWPCH